MGEDVVDFDHNPECRHCDRPRSNASDPSSDSYDMWIDPRMHNLAVVCERLKPYDAALMRCYPVSSRINNVANDDEECSRQLEIAESQNRLFV